MLRFCLRDRVDGQKKRLRYVDLRLRMLFKETDDPEKPLANWYFHLEIATQLGLSLKELIGKVGRAANRTRVSDPCLSRDFYHLSVVLRHIDLFYKIDFE